MFASFTRARRASPRHADEGWHLGNVRPNSVKHYLRNDANFPAAGVWVVEDCCGAAAACGGAAGAVPLGIGALT